MMVDVDTADLNAKCNVASNLVASGRAGEALQHYQAVLKIDPTHTKALCEFAELKMAGPHYLEALSGFHQQLQPKCYVEVGVCKGHSFRLASPDILAIGIDPAPQLDIGDLPDSHHVISDTSDNYFASGSILADMQGRSLDLAFIDGMHLFEYALRDFINLEKYAVSGTFILVHDVYPMNEPTARRERIADFWSGDVWKLIICLKQLRPDLSVQVLACPPTGLGVITNLDPNSRVLSDRLEQVVQDYASLPFSVLDKDIKDMLSVVDSVDVLPFL